MHRDRQTICTLMHMTDPLTEYLSIVWFCQDKVDKQKTVNLIAHNLITIPTRLLIEIRW